MSTNSGIEWTDATWSPITGCTRVSAGCDNCYSARMTYRLEMMGQQKYTGLTVVNPAGDRHFNGVVKCHKSELATPLGWRKPRRVFVCSMSDLFHRDVPFDFIDKVFAVMALCPQHVFQVLTKRPERMREYMHRKTVDDFERGPGEHHPHSSYSAVINLLAENSKLYFRPRGWPLPNVWLGTSIESRAVLPRADHLRECPASIRFLSLEPLLEDLGTLDLSGIHWSIVGGESGPGARPCNVEWIRSIVGQCKAAGAACFVKQLGKWVGGPHDYDGWKGSIDRWLLRGKDGKLATWRRPILRSQFSPEYYDQRPENAVAWGLANAKGGNPDEWPADLRVREFPGAAVPA